jgi:WXG100 family type VII secretion target
MTSGNLFTATTPDIQAGSASTLQKVEDIQAQLGQLNRLVDQSADSWRGAASNQFHLLMQEYQADSTQLNNALAAIGHALSTSGTNISNAEQTNLTNLTNIHLPSAKLS